MFYHVSMKDMGERFRFIPKVPSSAIVPKEGNVPRICVCPEVFYCLRAISGQKKLFSMDIVLQCRGKDGIILPTVYGTEKLPFLPPRVADFRKNKEHWFTTPITMKRVGYIDLGALVKGRVEIIPELRKVHNDELSGKGKDVVILEKRNIKRDINEVERLLDLCSDEYRKF